MCSNVGVSSTKSLSSEQTRTNVGVSLRARPSVLVGISYGVDSFVAKNLLREKGYEVHECNLDINSIEFEKVKKHFVDTYINALTPNICTYCNRHFKFYELNKKRKELGLDFYATGHYANVIFKDGRYAIKKSKNENKDQSYMLYNLSQEELSHLILPISDMDKKEVRRLAATFEGDIGQKYSEKKDSLDICFIQNKTYAEYIKEYFLGDDYKEKLALGKITKADIEKYSFLKSGKIVVADCSVGVSLRARPKDSVGANSPKARNRDVSPKVLAYHDGIINFTVGQRLYIDEKKTDLYVKKIDKNTLDVVVDKKENLYVSEFYVGDINFMLLDENAGSVITANVKTTYRGEEVKCECIFTNENTAYIKLHTPLIVSKGQAAVFYDEDGTILFGGTIM